MPVKLLKNIGNAGELSPYMDAGTDFAVYFNGWSKASNVYVLPQGGVVKSPGTKFIAKAKGACKIFSFEFSAEDNMIIEMGNEYARFFKDEERVMNDAETIADVTLTGTDPVQITVTTHPYSTGDIVRFYDVTGIATELNYVAGQSNEYTITSTGADTFTLDGTDSSEFTGGTFSAGTCKSIHEIISPFSDTEVFDLQLAYSGDVIYIAYGSYWPCKMTRLADNSWTLETTDFDPPPFLVENIIEDDYLECYCGSHTGTDNASVLTDSTQDWTTNALVGYVLFNLTDSCYGTITANTGTTITCSGGLSGGTQNDLDNGDLYVILEGNYIPEGLQVILKATGHTPFITTNDIYDGSYWQLKHKRQDNVIDNTPDNATNTSPTGSGIRIKGDYTFNVSDFTAGTDSVKLWRKVKNGIWQELSTFTVATAYSGTEEEDDVYYNYTTSAASTTDEVLTAKDQNHIGIIEINDTSYTTTSAIGLTKTAVYFYHNGYNATNNQTSMWSESAWNLYRGFPRAVCFHGGRLWWGGSDNNPKTIWGSVVNDFENHTVSSVDTDAVSRDISEGDVSGIQWMLSYSGLVCGTSSGEYLITAQDRNNPITPNDIRTEYQSSYGSNNIQPVMMNDAIFYVQRHGKKIRLMKLNDYGDRLNSIDCTLRANHLFESYEPVCMTCQKTPDSVLYVVRSDGTLCMYAYEPSEEISGWTRRITGSILDLPTDKFTSCAVNGSSTEDEIWVSVYRVIGGTGYYYIEKFGKKNVSTLTDSLMLDSAVVTESNYAIKNIVLASDTVRYGSGVYGSSYYGGTVV